jgi:anti-sigma B factor antagonist
MQMEDRIQGEVLLVKPLEERIDASMAGEFEARMIGWIRTGNRRLVLDLSGVFFIDSSGLGAIASALKTLGDQGRIAICGVSKTVKNLFQITRLDQLFVMCSSAEEAVEILNDWTEEDHGKEGRQSD